MTEASREDLSSLESRLQERINNLERKINLLPDPFSPVSMQQVRKGGTGATKMRRFNLEANNLNNSVATAYGTLSAQNANHPTSTVITHWGPTLVPSDYIQGGTMKFFFWWIATGTDSLLWQIVKVSRIRVGQSGASDLFTAAAAALVPTASLTIQETSATLTTLPEAGDMVYAEIKREGGLDDNANVAGIYGAFIEYLAFI